MVNIISFNGEMIKTYNETDSKILYEQLYKDFIFNFKLIYENKILSNNDKIIFQDNISLIMVKLPTKYLIIYDFSYNEISRINIERINNINYNIKYNQVKDLLLELKSYINDEYCILSNPEVYLYSYINFDNLLNNFFSNLNLLRLLYDDYDQILDQDYKLIIIKLHSPLFFGAIKYNNNNENIVNSYLIIKCAKQKYKCIGKITNFSITFNSFNEPSFVFTINNDQTNIITFYSNIKSLYFFESSKKYYEFKTYIELEFEKANLFLNN